MYIKKFINKIFNWFYSQEGYYCLKSGLYLDYYFKKITDRLHKEFNFYSGLIMLDTFLLNKLINKFFINYTQLNEKFINFKKKNNFFAMKQTLFILFIFILLLLLFILF